MFGNGDRGGGVYATATATPHCDVDDDHPPTDDPEVRPVVDDVDLHLDHEHDDDRSDDDTCANHDGARHDRALLGHARGRLGHRAGDSAPGVSQLRRRREGRR
jgi:hypothetical protein